MVGRAVAAAQPDADGGAEARAAAFELLATYAATPFLRPPPGPRAPAGRARAEQRGDRLEEMAGEELEDERDAIDAVCEPALADASALVLRAAVRVAVGIALRVHADAVVSDAGPMLVKPLREALARAVAGGDQACAEAVLAGLTELVALGWHALDPPAVPPLAREALAALAPGSALDPANRGRAAMLLREICLCRPDALAQYCLVPQARPLPAPRPPPARMVLTRSRGARDRSCVRWWR
jgi:hypothetical protein